MENLRIGSQPGKRLEGHGKLARQRATAMAPNGLIFRAVCDAGTLCVGDRMRYLSLGFFLFAFWLGLSGHYTPFLVTIGAVCAVACVFAAIRMRSADEEGHPFERLGAALTYIPWLSFEILKSGWAVTKIILHPALPISPTMTVVRASQKTQVGIATYANSITLTPGTITVGVSGNDLTIHALVRDGAIDLEAGGMDRRVSQFEGTA